MGKFVKGKSGNPGGRKKIPHDVREAFQKASPLAVQRLIDLLKSKNERISLDAAKTIIERVYGKAVQPLCGPDGEEIPVKIDLSDKTDEQLLEMWEKYQRALGGGGE